MSKHSNSKTSNLEIVENEVSESQNLPIDTGIKEENQVLTSQKSLNKTYLYTGISAIILILLIAGYYFYNNQTKPNSNNFASPNGPGRNTSRINNFTSINGKISSINDKTLVVDVANNGGQKIIILSEVNTQISKTTDSTKDYILKVDQTIGVDGDKNGETVNAKIITLRQIPSNPQNLAQNPNQNMNENAGQSPRMMSVPNGQNPNGNQNSFFGKITSLDGDKVTIQSFARPNSGNNNQQPPQQSTQSSTVIVVNTETKYNEQISLKISDLKEDQTINIAGNIDSGGNITARSIMVQ